MEKFCGYLGQQFRYKDWVIQKLFSENLIHGYLLDNCHSHVFVVRIMNLNTNKQTNKKNRWITILLFGKLIFSL